MHTELSQICVGPDVHLLEAMARLDAGRLGIVLVVDGDQRLLGTVTDGDLRRAVLAKLDLQQPVATLLERKRGTPYAHPVTASVGVAREEYLELLKTYRLTHLPVLDAQERVVGLVTSDEFLRTQRLALHAVVMAGGLGRRLHPLTEEVPKPMLPVGDRPLLEHIITQLRESGIQQVKVTTHHKPEKIEQHFGDGSGFGVQLSYVSEDRPLGTVGGLGAMRPTETTLVINGDILTQVDFRAMLAYHREHQADLTVAVRHYEMQVPYGVVDSDGSLVRQLTEKPVVGFFVNAGIYLLEPHVFELIPLGQRYDMTELIQRLLGDGNMVVSFPIREYWMDIGHHDDYERAHAEAQARIVAVK
jgi:dTDP-glucose pyrophosphorylase